MLQKSFLLLSLALTLANFATTAAHAEPPAHADHVPAQVIYKEDAFVKKIAALGFDLIFAREGREVFNARIEFDCVRPARGYMSFPLRGTGTFVNLANGLRLGAVDCDQVIAERGFEINGNVFVYHFVQIADGPRQFTGVLNVSLPHGAPMRSVEVGYTWDVATEELTLARNGDGDFLVPRPEGLLVLVRNVGFAR